MKRPNQYSHSFVLSSYSNFGLIEPTSPPPDPPVTAPSLSSYKSIPKPTRFTINNLSSLTEDGLLRKVDRSASGKEPSAATSASTQSSTHVRRSNSVVTQIFNPDAITAPSPTITPSLANEPVLEEPVAPLTLTGRSKASDGKGHKNDDSIVTQIYAPIKVAEATLEISPMPEQAAPPGSELRQDDLPKMKESKGKRHSQYKYEIPKSWISFGEKGSRYWKPLPQEPSMRTYSLRDPEEAASESEVKMETLTDSTALTRGHSKRKSKESASTASTSSPTADHHTPDTSPSATSLALDYPVPGPLQIAPKPAVTPKKSRRSRIPRPVQPSRPSTPPKSLRRPPSQLSDDFRVIDNMTMDSLLRSPAREPEEGYVKYIANFASKAQGEKVEELHPEGHLAFPIAGPEIYCTPPKSVPTLARRPDQVEKRSSFAFHRPQASRLPSQASFSGFSDAPDVEPTGADQRPDDDEDEAVPPPIGLRREDRPIVKSRQKSERSASKTGKKGRTLSLTGFMNGMSGMMRRTNTEEEVTQRAEQMKRSATSTKDSKGVVAPDIPDVPAVPDLPISENQGTKLHFQGISPQSTDVTENAPVSYSRRTSYSHDPLPPRAPTSRENPFKHGSRGAEDENYRQYIPPLCLGVEDISPKDTSIPLKFLFREKSTKDVDQGRKRGSKRHENPSHHPSIKRTSFNENSFPERFISRDNVTTQDDQNRKRESCSQSNQPSDPGAKTSSSKIGSISKKHIPRSEPTEDKDRKRYRETWGYGDKPLVTVLSYSKGPEPQVKVQPLSPPVPPQQEPPPLLQNSEPLAEPSAIEVAAEKDPDGVLELPLEANADLDTQIDDTLQAVTNSNPVSSTSRPATAPSSGTAFEPVSAKVPEPSTIPPVPLIPTIPGSPLPQPTSLPLSSLLSPPPSSSSTHLRPPRPPTYSTIPKRRPHTRKPRPSSIATSTPLPTHPTTSFSSITDLNKPPKRSSIARPSTSHHPPSSATTTTTTTTRNHQKSTSNSSSSSSESKPPTAPREKHDYDIQEEALKAYELAEEAKKKVKRWRIERWMKRGKVAVLSNPR